jgi:preprotein translocase subunit SecG
MYFELDGFLSVFVVVCVCASVFVLRQPTNSKGKFCGSKYTSQSMSVARVDVLKQAFLSRGIALVALSYHSPMYVLQPTTGWWWWWCVATALSC